MDRSTRRISLFRPGQRNNSARHHNEPREALNRLLTGVQPAQQRGTRAQSAPALRQFQVVFEQDDYLVGNIVSGTTKLAGAVRIAKPYLLRRTPFDGKARAGITYTYTSANTRTADDGNETEDQVIVPSYEAFDLIHVMLPVIDVISFAVLKPHGIDMNLDGRAWAKVAS